MQQPITEVFMGWRELFFSCLRGCFRTPKRAGITLAVIMCVFGGLNPEGMHDLLNGLLCAFWPVLEPVITLALIYLGYKAVFGHNKGNKKGD